MTTATTVNYEISSAPAMWGTDTRSQQREFFNNLWAEYCLRNAQGFNITALPLSPETAFRQQQSTTRHEEEEIARNLQAGRTEPEISPKNLEAIRILNQWFAEPDDLGEEFWNKFCEDLEKNRFRISR